MHNGSFCPHPLPNCPLKNSGFTLLEAIVALVILSAGLMAAYAWFSQDISHLIKMNELAQEDTLSRELIARLERQDFSQKASGSFHWADYRVNWQANLVEPVKDGRTQVGARSLYELSLYDVSVELLVSGRLFSTPVVRITQYRQVREPQFD